MVRIAYVVLIARQLTGGSLAQTGILCCTPSNFGTFISAAHPKEIFVGCPPSDAALPLAAPADHGVSLGLCAPTNLQAVDILEM